MGQATVTLKYVDPPKPGKKMGSISDGNSRYWVWGNEIPKFEVGETYKFNFKDSDGTGKFLTVVGAPELVGAAEPPRNEARLYNGNKDTDIATLAVAKIFGPLIARREFDSPITENVIAEILARCERGWNMRHGPPKRRPAEYDDSISDIGDTFDR